MFNIVLLHCSEVKKPNTTKAEAIKFVQMRFSKIIPESFESFSKIVWLIFLIKVLKVVLIWRTGSDYTDKILS